MKDRINGPFQIVRGLNGRNGHDSVGFLPAFQHILQDPGKPVLIIELQKAFIIAVGRDSGNGFLHDLIYQHGGFIVI